MALFGLIKRTKAVKQPLPDGPVMRELPVEAAPSPVPPPPPPAPGEVRQMLFEAIVSGDGDRLEQLCREHRQVIESHASTWMDAPEQLRANPDAAEWYVRGVRLLAQFCTRAA